MPQVPHSSAGDPEGRRVAKRRSILLSEAERLAYAVEILLRHADFDTSGCRELRKQISAQEQIELLRSHGRIEPRKRFKNITGQPLRENRTPNYLFIDESGVSNPEPNLPDSHFALGAVAMQERDVRAYKKAADAVKLRFFGDDQITFHEPLMRHREGIYYFNGDAQRQQEFDLAISDLIRRTKFVAFGVGVRKTAFKKEFVETGIDPYLPTDAYAVAITMLLERYVDFLATSGRGYLGRVTFESQGPREDAHHQWWYAGLLMDGTQWVPERAFRNWLETGVRFTPKSGSDPVELADFFSRDLYEWIRGGCQTTPKYWELFGKKIYRRGDGLMGKFGVKVFPDSDIRDLALAHRASCRETKN